MSRISPGTILVAFIAVLCGLLGAFVIRQSLKPRAAEEEARQTTVVVPAASMPLKAGREIAMGDIVIQRLSPQQIRDRGIKGPFMTDTRHIIGRILRSDVQQGATFDATMFYPEGLGPSIVEQLKPGLRAVTVPVEADDALLGFAGAGSTVDVLFRSNAERSSGQGLEDLPETTVTLMEMVEVIALNKDTFAGARRGDMESMNKEIAVTLAVTPEQAATLRVVEGRGALSLTLRHPDDLAGSATIAPQTLEEVLDYPRKKEYVDTYRRGRLSRVMFGRSSSKSPRQQRIGMLDAHPAAIDAAPAGTQPNN